MLQEDQLFATLDPTTRSRKLPSGQEILLTDTVGFIRKLPHHLIDAFKSTLEEAKYADLILHVVDASNPQMDEQMYVVYETLQRLEAMDKPVVTAFNKMDRIGESLTVRDFKADRIVQVSAKTGEGLEALLQAIEEILREQKIYIERVYSANTPSLDFGFNIIARKFSHGILALDYLFVYFFMFHLAFFV